MFSRIVTENLSVHKIWIWYQNRPTWVLESINLPYISRIFCCFSVFFGFVLFWCIEHTKCRHWNWRNLINNWKILNQGCFNNSKHFCKKTPKRIPYESRNITRDQSLFYSKSSKVREETVSQKTLLKRDVLCIEANSIKKRYSTKLLPLPLSSTQKVSIFNVNSLT